MVSIPTQCYNGSFEFIADKTYLYNKPTVDLLDVTGIKVLNADYTGIITEQHSFDGENFTDEIAMADFLMSDLEALYDGLTESKIITFRFWLSGDATLKTFIMNYRNGYDNDEK